MSKLSYRLAGPAGGHRLPEPGPVPVGAGQPVIHGASQAVVQRDGACVVNDVEHQLQLAEAVQGYRPLRKLVCSAKMMA